jgi:signal transduction histidine kinase
VFLVAKEAIHNVVKHAHAEAVRIRLNLESGSFTLEIEDNGRGPSGMNEKTGRNGLRNMRRRMEDIGGRFSIGPAPNGQGTVVQLSAPIRNA